LQGLGKMAGNILILPFKGALAFFDYEQKYSIITLPKIGTNSLENSSIKRIAVDGDNLWIEFEEGAIWKKKMEWNNISKDLYLADPDSWDKANKMPEEKTKPPSYIPTKSSFKLERVNVISVLPGGGAIAWGDDYYNFSRWQGEQWGESFKANASPFNDDQIHYDVKSLAMLPNENFAVGMWGPGLLMFDNGTEMKKWLHSKTTKCPTEYENGADGGWTIVQGVVAAPDFSGYIFSYLSEGKYGLGFADYSGYYHCEKDSSASSPAAFSIITRENEAKEWEIYAAWRSNKSSDSGGVDFYKTFPSKNFKPVLKKNYISPFGPPIDFAFDSDGILWAISNSKVFYLIENEWKAPSIRGFDGGINISSLETDAQNGLWIGTLGDGAYLLSKVNGSPDSLTAKHFKIKNGLLNEMIYDIAIDTIKGKVYFAHDLGLSVYSTATVRNASNYMQGDAPKPIAYPNPFRPKLHSAVKIDYISQNSIVYIFDSSGKRVRFFNTDELRGGQAIWDGKNETGTLVAPGLYHYMVKDGKKTAKGKIMVER